MKNKWMIPICTLGISQWLGSCSDDTKGEPPNSRPPDETAPSAFVCPAEITELINVNDGEDTVPSWESLDCFSKDLVRLPQPNFLAGALADLARYSEDRTTRNLGWVMYSDIDAQHATAVSNRSIWNNLSAVPPYVELETNTLYTFPLKPEWHEKKIRVAAAMLIAQKLKKRYTTAVFFYPPKMNWAPIASSVADFKTWYTEHFIPEKIVEAKALERIQVESYSPFQVELETWVEWLPFASSTPVEEKVALAQWMVDSLVPKLREHFKGSITVHSYVNYELKGSQWNTMNYEKFDLIGFSYFPICGGTNHEIYLQTQFENYLSVVSNSGNKKWGMTEIGPDEANWVGNGCMPRDEYSAKELEIYSALIDKMEAIAPAPVASGFPNKFVNTETRKRVEAYVRSKIESIGN